MIFKNKDKLFKSAEKFVLQGRFEQAIAQYKKIVQDNPNDLSTLNVIGDLHTRLGQTREAIHYYSSVAEQYRTFNYLPKAIAMYKKMEQLSPENLDISLTLGDLYLEEGLKAAAKNQYQRVADRSLAAGDRDRAGKTLLKIVKIEPDNPKILNSLGDICALEHDNSSAQGYFLDAGDAYLSRGDLELGRAIFHRVLAMNENSLDALRGLMKASSQPDHYEEIVEKIQGLSKDMRENPDTLVLLGESHLKLGHFEETERIFRQLIFEDEERFYGKILEFAETLVEAEQYDKAVEQIEEVTVVLLSHRELESGISILKRILEKNPQHTPALILLAEFLQKTNQDAAAAEALEQLAHVQTDLKQYEEALQTAERLLGLAPLNEGYRELHRQIFSRCHPGKTYVPPEMERAEYSDSSPSGMAPVEEGASHERALEFNMLVKYGMLQKARDLLVGCLKDNPGDSWAKIQLGKLEKDADQNSARFDFSMPEWLQESEEEQSSGAAQPEESSQEQDTALRGVVSGEGFAPRSVIPPETAREEQPGAGHRTSGPGPRSLDLVGESSASVEPLNARPSEDDGTSTSDMLKNALSEEIINETVDSFFGEIGEAEAQTDSRAGFTHFYERGEAHRQAGRNAEAIEEYKKAFALILDSPASQEMVQCCTCLGLCHLGLGEAPTAIEWFRKALETRGLGKADELGLKYELAQAYEILGDWSRIRQELEWIVQQDPQFRDAMQKLENLKEADRD